MEILFLQNMAELIYLTDSYKQNLQATVVSSQKHGELWRIVLSQTIFYPQGGGQPSDKGDVVGPHGKAHVKHVSVQNGEVIHECVLEGEIAPNDEVSCSLDWPRRYLNMRLHSAGHIIHEAVKKIAPQLIPLRGNHAENSFIEYQGSLPIDKTRKIEEYANEIVKQNLTLRTAFVTYEELLKLVTTIPPHLPKNKPLRIVQIDDCEPVPDGGTQVNKTGEVGEITVGSIENSEETVRVYYSLAAVKTQSHQQSDGVNGQQLISALLEYQRETLKYLEESNQSGNKLQLEVFGQNSEFTKLVKQIAFVPQENRQQVGIIVNQVKQTLEKSINKKEITHQTSDSSMKEWFDVTAPGILPAIGHLHIVTQAIMDITRIFEHLGFTRVRHPEVDWDWYAFESLNMPPQHPARDEWETFFIEYPGKPPASRPGLERKQIVLTPHTSNGQVREMEKGKLPIRMINIAKCYRRQSDISHVPMFHQFEGMYIDKNVSIGHLKGFIDYFVKQYFGPERKSRLRPFHFQFTEPSFEVDVSCGLCAGKGCKLCKEGWLELAGSGMIHPNVLKSGGVDPIKYSGFAIGWGVERTAMMRSDTKLDDIRLLYGNDVRFLEQF